MSASANQAALTDRSFEPLGAVPRAAGPAPAAGLKLVFSAVEQWPYGMLIVRRSGQILGANAMAEKIFRYGPDRLAGRNIQHLLPGFALDMQDGGWDRLWSTPDLERSTAKNVAAVCGDGEVESLDLEMHAVGHASDHLVALFVELRADRLRRPSDVHASVGEAPAAPTPRPHRKTDKLCLRRDVEDQVGTGPIVGNSPAFRKVMLQAEQVASTDSTALLLGETGTGKELLATHIHEMSARRAREMVRVNCAAIPSTLIESELFGRERGAFTGALARQIGRFELADRSTILLDEIGDLPPEVQVKLLRVLEAREIERLGNPRAIRVDVRIIAATHRNLEQLIAEGKFREDLFYRLNVFPIEVPPLRNRVEDIPLLVWRFVDEFSRAFGKPIEAIPRECMDALQSHSWPGNIREMRNVVERAMIVAEKGLLEIELPSTSASPNPERSSRIADVEKEHIRRVLESTGWRIRGARGAADRLGLRPTTLETRMIKLGLTRPQRLQS